MFLRAAQPGQAAVGERGSFAKKQYSVRRNLRCARDIASNSCRLRVVGAKNSGPLAWGRLGERAGNSGQKIQRRKQFGVKLKSRVHF